MDQRRAAGALLALTACIACTAAAPTASNQTGLDLYDGAATEGCYYNFQHYGEGDRIMTNEPCLNCTCHNRMLMCYLRVCPFTKPIGQDCTVEKRADQCCPIVTCPDVPVDLLTSTSTSSPAEYGATGLGKLDKYGCSINGRYFPEGSKVPPTPNKPCEHCYCIRNMTTCVMQECTLHVDGCTPIYHKDVCCPVRYSCDHPEDEVPLLDDLSTTVRPTPGFLLTTTTVAPVTQITQDCIHDDQIFPDGTSIKTEKACEHCYCMKGDIVCVVQECGTPMENEGKNCTSQPPREGQCCPDTYICEGDEPVTEISSDLTTQTVLEELTTLSPPRRVSDEGSGYKDEQDEEVKIEKPEEESETGSGDSEQVILESSDEDKKQTVANISPTTENIHETDYVSTTLSSIEIEKETTETDKEFNTVPADVETSKPEEEFTSLLDKEHESPTHTTEPAYRKEDEESSEIFLQNKDKETSTSESTEKTMVFDETPEKETTLIGTTETPSRINAVTTKIEDVNILSTSATRPSDIIDSTEDNFRTTETQETIMSETPVYTIPADIYQPDKESTEESLSHKLTTESPIEISTPISKITKEAIGTTESLTEISITDITKATKEPDFTEHVELTTSLPVETAVIDSNKSPEETSLTSEEDKDKTGSPVETTAPYDSEFTKESIGSTIGQEITTVSIPESSIDSISEHSKETAETVLVQDVTTPTVISELEKESTRTTNVLGEEFTTLAPNKNDFATIDTQENEIGDFTSQSPGRIPGEGDCLLDGITYRNESVVPSTNKCQTECKCVSSIIKCDPIICSYPPEYMNSCVPTYDSPDACCPTYICDESHETILPQAHSQMSGTESPLTTPTTECRGDQCDLQKEQKPHVTPISTENCINGDCNLQTTSSISICEGENCKERPSEVQKPCDGENCKTSPTLPCSNGEKCEEITPEVQKPCDGENCEVSPTQLCGDGEKCKETAPEIQKPCEGEDCKISPTQSCGDGEKCEETSPEIQKPCNGENCEVSQTQLCEDGEKCKETAPEIQKPCEGENCKTGPTQACSDGEICNEIVPELQKPCEGEKCKISPTQLCNNGEKCEEISPETKQPCEGENCKISSTQTCGDGEECEETLPEIQKPCEGESCKVVPTQICQSGETCDETASDVQKPCEGENCKISPIPCGDGEKCEQTTPELQKPCEGENCKVRPTQICSDGEKCEEITPEIKEPCEGENCKIQPCADGEKCDESTSETSKPCNDDTCSVSQDNCNNNDCGVPSLDQEQQPCQGDDCQKTEQENVEDCTEESCKKKIIPGTESKLQPECTSSECDQQKPVSSEQPELETMTTISDKDVSQSISDIPSVETELDSTKYTSELPSSSDVDEIEKPKSTTENILRVPDITTTLPELDSHKAESPEIDMKEKQDIPLTTEAELSEAQDRITKPQDESISTAKPDEIADKATSITEVGISEQSTESSVVTEIQDEKTDSIEESKYTTLSSLSESEEIALATKIPESDEQITVKSQEFTESSITVKDEETRKSTIPTVEEAVTQYPGIYTEDNMEHESPVTTPENVEKVTEKEIVTEKPHRIITEKPGQEPTESLITDTTRLSNIPVTETSELVPEISETTIEQSQTETTLFDKDIEEKPKEKEPTETSPKPDKEITETEATIAEVDITKQEIEVTTQTSPKDSVIVTSESSKMEDEYVTLSVITKKPDASEIPQTEVTILHATETESSHLPDTYGQNTETPEIEKLHEDKFTTADEISVQTTVRPTEKEPVGEQITYLTTAASETPLDSIDKLTTISITEDKSKIKPSERPMDDIFTEIPEIDTEEPSVIKMDEIPVTGTNNGTIDLESPDYIPVYPSTVSVETEKYPDSESSVTEITDIIEEPQKPEVEIQQMPDFISPTSEIPGYETSEITTIKAHTLEHETVTSDLEGSTTRPDKMATEKDSYTKLPETDISEEIITKVPISDITPPAETDISDIKDENTSYSTTEEGQILDEEKEKVTKLPETLPTEQEGTTKLPDSLDHQYKEPSLFDKDQQTVTTIEHIPVTEIPVSEFDKVSTEPPESLSTQLHDLSTVPEKITTSKEQKLVTDLPQEFTMSEVITSVPIESVEPSTTIQPSYIEGQNIFDDSKPEISKETEIPQSHVKETEERTTQSPLLKEPEVDHIIEKETIQPIPIATTERSETSESESEVASPEHAATEKPKIEDDMTKTPVQISETDTTPDIVELVEHTEPILEISTKSPLEEKLTESPEKSTTERLDVQNIDEKYTIKEELTSENPQKYDFEPEPEKDLTTETSIPLEIGTEQKLDVEIEHTTISEELLQETPTSRPLPQQTELEQKLEDETSSPFTFNTESEHVPSEKVTTEPSKIFEDEHKSTQAVEILTEEVFPDKIHEAGPSTDNLPEKIPDTTTLPVQFTHEISSISVSTEQSQDEIYTTSLPVEHLSSEVSTPIEHSIDELSTPGEEMPDKIAPGDEADKITTISPLLEHQQTSTIHSSAEYTPTEISSLPPSIDNISHETKLPHHEDFTSTTELSEYSPVTIQPSDRKPDETLSTNLPLEELSHDSSTTYPLSQKTEVELKPIEESTSPIPDIGEIEPHKVPGDISSTVETYTTEKQEYEDTSHKIPTNVSPDGLETEHDKESTEILGTTHPDIHKLKPMENETIIEPSSTDIYSGTTIAEYVTDKTTSPSMAVEESTSSTASEVPVIQEDIKKEDEVALGITSSPIYPTKEEPTTLLISDKLSTAIPVGDIDLGTDKPIEFDHAHDVTEADGEFLPASTKTSTPRTEEIPSTESNLFDKTTKTEDKLSEVPAETTVQPEIPKPGINEIPITDEVPEPEDHEDHEVPSAGGGYGSDYADDDQPFGPGTCRYGGKVYVSAQQIPRDDPCDFCFCFRSDIICLQQSCPPPIHGCHEEPIQGFCCPRYECPVSMATALNVTTTTTTTTTTLPPHFLPHAYKGAAYKRGCQIKGHSYKVGEVVRASSGPCLHCTCGGDGQMKCDPKACTPEPMLRQMIAAAVSAKRRR
ncbi:uncharacterized protein LOC113517566 [Galleria mellonella]|uniref:Uncharacterized protein LOC113517566 n=1 Tax=Galleria mellonella TaxID=7137 RepID=A0A6J1WYT2_GALME|nr:uncharacterized protein LOC113517566 [Galleria mellonella]